MATSPLPGQGDDAYDHIPMLEVEAVHHQGPVQEHGDPLRMLEVWTQNRVYVMNPSMVCVEVRDAATGTIHRESDFVGHRLVGGQRTYGGAIELSTPFPRPGSEAVFERVQGEESFLSRTSTVRRVLLRLQVVTVESRGVAPTWAQLKRASLSPGPMTAGKEE